MRLKQEIMELLRHGRERELAEKVAADRRAVRPVLARLWDPDAQIRGGAARALGQAAAEHPDLGQEVVRRLLWALNDESATNGVYGVPALGEIGRRAPELLAPHISALASMAWDSGLRLELLAALTALAEAAPQHVAPHLATIERHLDTASADEGAAFRRLAAAAGEEVRHEL
jgi:hypothetical protein